MSMEPRFRFNGQVALVTGSSRNLGLTIAQVLSEQGAEIAIHFSSHRTEAEALAESVRRHGGAAHLFQADLTQGDQVQSLANAVLERFGRVDILVNNVGPYSDLPFMSLPIDDWDRVMNSGLRASYLLAQALAPGMKERGSGNIVNISAGSAFIRVHSIYGLTKAAVIHLTESLALELAPEIRVNAVAPGQIQESDELTQVDPHYLQRMTESTPLRRLVTRAEVAHAVCLLCSDDLPSLTGQTLVLDGGWTIPAGREAPSLHVSL